MSKEHLQYKLTTMGWLRLGGSLKIQVSFAKEPYKREYILQKRPMILGSLPIVAIDDVNMHKEQDNFSVIYMTALVLCKMRCKMKQIFTM